MIRLQDATPEVYYKQSRDFQFIGRLYDLVLNSAKTNAELLYNLPLNDNTDNNFIDLLTLTLGFKQKHNYSTSQLYTISTVFTTVLKYKGSLEAIKIVGQALLKSEGINEEFNCYIENNRLKIFIPRQLTDLNLLNDLLEYILPAGLSCEIIRTASTNRNYGLQIGVENNVEVTARQEKEASAIIKPTEATNVYDLTANNTFINSTVNKNIANGGN